MTDQLFGGAEVGLELAHRHVLGGTDIHVGRECPAARIASSLSLSRLTRYGLSAQRFTDSAGVEVEVIELPRRLVGIDGIEIFTDSAAALERDQLPRPLTDRQHAAIAVVGQPAAVERVEHLPDGSVQLPNEVALAPDLALSLKPRVGTPLPTKIAEEPFSHQGVDPQDPAFGAAARSLSLPASLDQPLTRFHRHPQWIGIGEAVIVADLNERLRWQAAVSDKFLGVAEGDYVVSSAVQNHRVRLNRRGSAPSLPRWAKQDQRRVARVDVHGNGTAARRADDHVRVMPVVFGLGGADGRIEVVIIEARVDDFVAVICKVGWLHATRDTVPAVEK